MTPDLRFTARSGRAARPAPAGRAQRRHLRGEPRHGRAGAVPSRDPFGDATYELTAGQHVLFEHGSLHEVVDHETSPCGCPDEKGVPVADALIAPAAAAQHPFPVAISEGLAPEAEVPQAPPGEVHTQVSEALNYNASGQRPGRAAGTPSRRTRTPAAGQQPGACGGTVLPQDIRRKV